MGRTVKEERVDAIFAALSDRSRRDVMRFISEFGEASASELAEQMPISRQAIVKHLTALADAGLVSAEREGRQVRYRLTPEPLNEAMRWIAEVGAEWDDRLRALERMLRRRRR
jgi:DNA-binding transcriptional ArsR family regulator